MNAFRYLNASGIQSKHYRKSWSTLKHHMPLEVYAFLGG